MNCIRHTILGFSILGLGLVALPSPAQAQVNTESMRSKKKEDGVHGFFAGALSWQTGSTNVLAATAAARLEYNYKIHHPFLQASYSMGQKDKEKFLHNGFLHARWPAMWHRRVGTELFSQLQFDEFRLLTLRALAGAGVRVAAVIHKKVSLHIGSGYMFEYERLALESTNPHPDTTYHHRWTNYVSIRVNVSKWLTLFNVLYAQPRFDKFSDVRILEDLSFQFTVYKTLKLVLTFILEYDSDPPDTVERLNTVLLNSLKVVF